MGRVPCPAHAAPLLQPFLVIEATGKVAELAWSLIVHRLSSSMVQTGDRAIAREVSSGPEPWSKMRHTLIARGPYTNRTNAIY